MNLEDPEDASPTSGKRRKKRKPKQGAAQGLGANPESASQNQVDKQEAASRFATALEHLQRDSAESTWTKLDKCNIFDGKTKKIAKALMHNKTLISLDLSGNHISEPGIQALADALHNGGAPELILLDLHGNDLSNGSMDILMKLGDARRQLKIQLKVETLLETPDPPAQPEKSRLAKDKEPAPQSCIVAQSNGPPASSFWQRFFQIGGGRGFGAQDMQSTDSAELTETAAEVVWAQVTDELNKEIVELHELSKHLYLFVTGIRKEMETCDVPFLSNTKLDELRPYTKEAVQGLEQLQAVLDLPAPAHLTPFSKSTSVEAVGSHVVIVAQIVERLSYARTGVINIHVVKACLVPRLMALSFQYPRNSALQSTCCQIMRWMIASKLRLLWEPLLRADMGLKPELQAVTGGKNLLALISQTLESAIQASSIAQRSCETGFAFHIASQLYDESSKIDTLKSSLQACEEWGSLLAEGSAFQKLRKEQEGELCGPRPAARPRFGMAMQGADEVGQAAVESVVDSDLPNTDEDKLFQLMSQEGILTTGVASSTDGSAL